MRKIRTFFFFHSRPHFLEAELRSCSLSPSQLGQLQAVGQVEGGKKDSSEVLGQYCGL